MTDEEFIEMLDEALADQDDETLFDTIWYESESVDVSGAT